MDQLDAVQLVVLALLSISIGAAAASTPATTSISCIAFLSQRYNWTGPTFNITGPPQTFTLNANGDVLPHAPVLIGFSSNFKGLSPSLGFKAENAVSSLRLLCNCTLETGSAKNCSAYAGFVRFRLYQKVYKEGGGLYFDYRANTTCSSSQCEGEYLRVPQEQDKKSYSAALLLNWDEFDPEQYYLENRKKLPQAPWPPRPPRPPGPPRVPKSPKVPKAAPAGHRRDSKRRHHHRRHHQRRHRAAR